MQHKKNPLSYILIGIIFFYSFTYAAHPSKNVRIGVISAFPTPLGMFYDNRALYRFSKDKTISLFPERTCAIPYDVNILLTKYLANTIQNRWDQYEVSQITVDPNKELIGGYQIEGIWGRDVASINIKNISQIMHDKSLDFALAVVPVTYHVPPLDSEGTGFGLCFNKTGSYAYTVYTILMYKNDNGTINKISDSKKLVSYTLLSKKIDVDLKNKNYSCQYLDLYLSYLEKDFFPLLGKQSLYLLGDKNISYSKYFKTPKKPYHYYLPH